MDATKYQQLAARTLIDAPDFPVSDHDIMVVWNALGLAGEAGEVCDLLKKGIFHQKGVDRIELGKEMGDVCWYLAAIASKYQIDLSAILEANIAKLRARYPNGYTAEDSQARIDTIK